MLNKKALVAVAALLVLMVASPALAAQEGGLESAFEHRLWIALATAFGMAIASAGCGMAQGRAVSAACEALPGWQRRESGEPDAVAGLADVMCQRRDPPIRSLERLLLLLFVLALARDTERHARRPCSRPPSPSPSLDVARQQPVRMIED